MYKEAIVLLAIAASGFSAEISQPYSLLEKQASFNPELRTEAVGTHGVTKKDARDDVHPVFKEGRARIELVNLDRPVIKHNDMLSDQPAQPQSQLQDVNRVDMQQMPAAYGYIPATAEVTYPDVPYAPGYGYIPATAEVTYPDVPYAPGYGYDSGYAATNNYDIYGNNLSGYMLEPDTSALSMLWSQVPDARAVVGFFGRTIAWAVNSIFIILLGSFLTIGVCSYTNLCSIQFHGVGPIHEEMRSLMSPERLQKISHAADFVKSAIDKYQKIQKVDNARSKRSIFG